MRFKILSILLFFCLIASAQESQDVIFMKDGTVLKGKIVERLDDGAIKMLLSTGREVTVAKAEIKQVTIDGIGTDKADYGGATAFGISFFGDGFMAAHFRFRLAEEFYGDIEAALGATLVQNRFNNEALLKGNLHLGLEGNYFLHRRFKEKTQKVRGNGIFFRGAHGFGEFEASSVAAGWCSEYFKMNRYKRGFLLNLGYMLRHNAWVTDPANTAYTRNVPEIQPVIYFRVQWNFF